MDLSQFVLEPYRSPEIPDPGLEAVSGGSGVLWCYVLLCERGRLYVGIEHGSKIEGRIAKHVAGAGAAFTSVFKPLKLYFLHPVKTATAEAFLYFICLKKTGDCAMVGGWTQTSVKPSPIARYHFEDAQRLLGNMCFKCGAKSHFASQCTIKTPPARVVYKCNGCGLRNALIGAGKSAVLGVSSPLKTSPSKSSSPGMSKCAKSPEKKGLDSTPVASPKVQVAQRSDPMAVLVNGELFTCGGWLLGRKPTRGENRLIREFCLDGAVEFFGTTFNGLKKFARPGEPVEVAGFAVDSEWRESKAELKRRGDQPLLKFKRTSAELATGVDLRFTLLRLELVAAAF